VTTTSWASREGGAAAGFPLVSTPTVLLPNGTEGPGAYDRDGSVGWLRRADAGLASASQHLPSDYSSSPARSRGPRSSCSIAGVPAAASPASRKI
jgi:hypothetical protein